MSKAQKTVVTSVKLIADNATLDKFIKSIHTRGQSIQKDMHIAACSVLDKVRKDGDVRFVHKLIAAMPESARVNALKAWFENFGPVKFENDKITHVKGGKVDMDKAQKTPFWAFQPEAPYQALDLMKFLTQMEKKLRDDEDKREGGTTVGHAVLLQQIQSAKEALTKTVPAN